MHSMRDRADITSTMKRHANTVLRVCSLYFHGRPERDDAFQETFIKYSQSDKVFADDEHVKAWLINVAANTCKDMRKRTEANLVLLDEIDEASHPNWASDGPDQQEQGGRLDELAEALQLLEENYRVALYLKYYEGYTAAEIAKLTNMPENTVYTNLSRGRTKLKEVLTHGERARQRDAE